MVRKILDEEELISKRVFFETSFDRTNFFLLLKRKYGSWSNVATHFGLYKSRLEKLRNGNVSTPIELFQRFLKGFDDYHTEYFGNVISLREKNWGRIKGGRATYQKHKDIFEKGRKIGSSVPRYIFPLNTPLTPELCELIGAFIGDGFTNKYGSRYVVQYSGDATLDFDYHIKYLRSLFMRLFPGSHPIHKIWQNTSRITINSKQLFELLTKRFGFIGGKKAYTVLIPREILESENKECILKCVRGIFDTDGCVFFDKRDSYKKPYIRIALELRSKELIKQISFILRKEGINLTITNDGEKIQINGYNNCVKFIRKVGFSNQRHLIKIRHII
ncbi:MAG TPA: LAGLIDADG family homing endonuclease [Candidatus Nanoarchaeia archaeon]|nr:LAGLIDADG family homing endonuclease [Candidatus Nanoarchaeia archaeon]